MLDLVTLWDILIYPLLRLLTGLAIGLLIASILEELKWTKHLGKLAKPLARAANMGESAAASFSLSFVSSVSATALLAQSYTENKISRKELVLSNLFNSLPVYLLHTPTIFFLALPTLGSIVFIYVGLTLLAALTRTLITVVLGNLLLEPNGYGKNNNAASSPVNEEDKEATTKNANNNHYEWSKIFAKAWARFLRYIPKLLMYTIPIYTLIVFLQRGGVFLEVETWIANNFSALSFLNPQALSIVVCYMFTELGATFSVASSLLENESLGYIDVVMALMVGNILSTPMRAIRHQFPSYAGYFNPSLALYLIIFNQGLRALSLIFVAAIFYLCI